MATKLDKSKENYSSDEQMSESYISIGLGVLVVVVVGVLLYNYFTQRNQNQQTPSPTSQITQEATTSAVAGATYIVQPGDTLWSVSEKAYGTGFRWTEIAEANNLAEGAALISGQQLALPEDVMPSASTLAIASSSPAASEVAQVLPSPSPSPVATPVMSPSPVPSSTTTPTLPGAAISGTSYTVVHGDTLWSIACRAYNDCYAWTKIAQANKLVNPNMIHAGNVFTLPR